jgi:hypothetical protein
VDIWQHVRSKGGGSSGSILLPFKTPLRVLVTNAVVASIQADESKGDALNDTLVSCAGCNGELIGTA